MVRSDDDAGSCAAGVPKSVWFTGSNFVAAVAMPENFFARAYTPLAPGGSAESVLGTSHVEAIFTPTTNSSRADSVFARLADGRVFGVGNNYHAALGIDDTTAYLSAPTLLPGWSGVSRITPSAFVTLGVFPDGRILAAGDASTGSLGVAASNTLQRAPSAIPGLNGVRYAAISDSPSAAFAITADGLYFWGTDQSFSEAAQAEPLAVATPGAGPFTTLSLSSGHVAAIDERGAVYTWGADSAGQLGCGKCGAQTSPRLVTTP
jgi:alpha-tubulin suppressor-like RCC1 family protein